MALQFKKAVREQLWIKLLLSGPSGSGKTYSALRLATGLASKTGGAGVAYIDTENRRASYYADEFNFDVIDMEEPYTPEKYIEAIDAAIDAGYKVLCIDSLSSEWRFLNDVHDNMPGNSFTNWGKLKPRHNKFMEKVLQAKIHIIATARGKDAYTLEDKNGRQVPRKVGEGVIGDKELEYNYTCTFQLTQDSHIATVMKDNTHIFEGRYDVLTEKDGVSIYTWANEGEVPSEKPVFAHAVSDESAPNTVSDEVASAIENISGLCKSLTDAGVSKMDIANVIKRYHFVNGRGVANFRTITDIDIANKIITDLKDLGKTE